MFRGSCARLTFPHAFYRYGCPWDGSWDHSVVLQGSLTGSTANGPGRFGACLLPGIRLTRRIPHSGCYARFTFTGDSVTMYGATGPKAGVFGCSCAVSLLSRASGVLLIAIILHSVPTQNRQRHLGGGRLVEWVRDLPAFRCIPRKLHYRWTRLRHTHNHHHQQPEYVRCCCRDLTEEC